MVKRFLLLFLILVFNNHTANADALSRYEALPLETPPEFSLEDSLGKSLALGDLRGKVVLVNFWAPWCPSCRKEMPSLNRLADYFQDQEVQIVLASSRPFRGENPSNYLLSQSFQFLQSHFDERGQAAQAFGVKGLPTTLFFNPQGKLVGRLVGAAQMDAPEMIDMIQDILHGAAPQPSQTLWERTTYFFKHLF
ncbi:MAG: TlpA family protein disulfide reductase [bacterium]|nr:TlpA family protein disulfide reductase [bacterium]